MSNTVGIRELRQDASTVLKRVAAGEVIEVTDHGHPVARIVPIHHGALDQLIVEGRVTPAGGDLLNQLDQMSLPGSSTGSDLPSVALSELRDQER